MTIEHADLLTTVTRDRARAYAKLADAISEVKELRRQLREAQLDATVARELLAYHGHTPIPRRRAADD